MVDKGQSLSVFFDKTLFYPPLEVLTMKPPLTLMLPQINRTFQQLFPPQPAPSLGEGGQGGPLWVHHYVRRPGQCGHDGFRAAVVRVARDRRANGQAPGDEQLQFVVLGVEAKGRAGLRSPIGPGPGGPSSAATQRSGG